MRQEKYISIVIPVYNCEKYIARCLDSVLNQTYKWLEIIVINDGSTDQTADICRKYVQSDTRVKYVEQQNKGVAYTRKRGIQLATGDYVGFVDADDYIDKDMYEQMIMHMENVDLVTSGYYCKEKRIFAAVPQGIYQTEEEKKYLYENMFFFKDTKSIGILPNLWSKLFVTAKIKKIVDSTALDVFVGEDADIVYRYILLCDSICISEICAYHHEFNEKSIMQTVNKNYLRNINSLYLSLEEVFSKSIYNNILLPKWNQWVWQMIQQTPHFMGFDLKEQNRVIRYLNPYMNLLNEKKIILYGAGVVGKDYYRLYQKHHEVELVLWVDNKWERLQKDGFFVQSVEQIQQVTFDYILLAVKEQRIAQEIREQLCQKGINDKVILWNEPINLE